MWGPNPRIFSVRRRVNEGQIGSDRDEARDRSRDRDPVACGARLKFKSLITLFWA